MTGLTQVVAPIGKHIAPFGCGWFYTDAQKTETGSLENCSSNPQGDLNNNGSYAVGQKVK